jgi:inorganic phosphate transporter, PiT family
MQKPIIDISLYEDDSLQLLIGCVSALAGCTIWLLIATSFGMPVSSMHSMFGSIVAFSLVAKGLKGIDSNQLG